MFSFILHRITFGVTTKWINLGYAVMLISENGRTGVVSHTAVLELVLFCLILVKPSLNKCPIALSDHPILFYSTVSLYHLDQSNAYQRRRDSPAKISQGACFISTENSILLIDFNYDALHIKRNQRFSPVSFEGILQAMMQSNVHNWPENL